jgi:hypothetical protein
MSPERPVSLAKKLNVKEGTRVRVVGLPAGLDLGDVPAVTSATPTTSTPSPTSAASADAQGVLVFARTLADVDATCGPAIDAARQDRLAWIAYPKAGQLGTDLNRDVLWQHLLPRGIQGVRQVAIDNVWSAMRFRPRT